MRTTVTIDDDLLERVKGYTGITDTKTLVRRAVEYIIAYEKGVARTHETGDLRDVGRVVRELYENADDE